MDDCNKCKLIRGEINAWLAKVGHDRCHYYPDIFFRVCAILDISVPKNPPLPPQEEFEKFCARYRHDQYED